MRLVRPVVVCTLLATAPAAAQCTEGCLAIHTLTGQAAGDQFGWVSNDLGDLNGDGISEFVLTAPTRDEAGFNSGKVYVYDGATATRLGQRTGP